MGRANSIGFCCGVCQGEQTSEGYETREMMFGLRTRFHYAQCAGCGSLWLMDPPSDFSSYYPEKYYSFMTRNGGLKGRFKEYMRTKRDRTYFGSHSPLGGFLAERYRDSAIQSVAKLNVGFHARILDVGCGGGKLLQQMAALGFTNLAGVDPFVRNNDQNTDNGVKIHKCQLEDLVGEKYDVVMFHHSLEHVADPAGTLLAAGRLLAARCKCLVRLPVVARAWEQYKTNWVQLDPPRHMWVPTERAMRKLAESAGFRVDHVEYDSTEFQFWGSELYARDLPLMEAGSRGIGSYFRHGKIAEFRKTAESLNRESGGDQAAFFLEC